MSGADWINSDERLPDNKRFVLVYHGNTWGDIQTMYYVPPRSGYCHGWYPGGLATKRTYWMELPPPPSQPTSAPPPPCGVPEYR